MYRLGWTGLGIGLGIILTALLGWIVVIQILIPWEAICATVAPAQEVVRLGNALTSELLAWLDKAEDFLAVGATPEQTEQAREGISGLLDRAKGELQATTSVVADIVTAPLRLLIDTAQLVLASVLSVTSAAQESLASIDQSRCS